MKQILTLIIMASLMFSSVSLISAQETNVPAGTTPENSILYGIDIAFENIRMVFLGDEEKINYGLQIAEERLSEMEQINEANLTDSEKSQAIERIEQIRNRNVEQVRERTINQNETVRERVRNQLNRHVRILEKVKQNAPQEAQMGLQTAIENSQRAERIIRNAPSLEEVGINQNQNSGGIFN